MPEQRGRHSAEATEELIKTATKIFFWSDDSHPELFVDTKVSPLRRLALIGVLNSGETVKQYRGIAKCRMKGCLSGVGSGDDYGYGYLWPSGAAHYVKRHGVWVPAADDLLDRAIRSINTDLLIDMVNRDPEFAEKMKKKMEEIS